MPACPILTASEPCMSCCCCCCCCCRAISSDSLSSMSATPPRPRERQEEGEWAEPSVAMCWAPPSIELSQMPSIDLSADEGDAGMPEESPACTAATIGCCGDRCDCDCNCCC